MEQTVTIGTGNQAFVRGLDICGKTGTSQNPHGEDHSVFFAFAPKDDPKIAIAVYVENAGFGGDVAAPIAGLMIEKYLNREISPYRKYLEDRITNLKLINKELVSN
jgi:penicillin-binding protein 2